MEKIFRRALTALLIVTGLLAASIGHAEVKTYEGVGEYFMSDFETFDIAQQRAQQRAERDACEKAGVYVESRTEVLNSQVNKDEIIIMTRNILKIVDVKYHREHSDNNTTRIRATVVAQIDSEDVSQWFNKDPGEKTELIAQMEALRKANEDQERQIAELQKKLAAVQTPQDKKQIAIAFATEDRAFLSNQKVAEAWSFYNRGEYVNAIDLFNEAIKLYRDNALAYFGRGTVYYNQKQYVQAIFEFDKAVELNPALYQAYYNRGNAYQNLNQYEQAIQNYSACLSLNPNDADTCYNRANAYFCLNQYDKAIADYDRTIALNPNYAAAYNNRGLAYQKLGNYSKAQADLAKAGELR